MEPSSLVLSLPRATSLAIASRSCDADTTYINKVRVHHGDGGNEGDGADELSVLPYLQTMQFASYIAWHYITRTYTDRYQHTTYQTK